MSQRSVPGCIERLWDGENRSLYYMEYQRAKNDILKASIREAIDYETSYYEFFDSMEEVISYLKKNSDKDEHERFEVQTPIMKDAVIGLLLSDMDCFHCWYNFLYEIDYELIL